MWFAWVGDEWTWFYMGSQNIWLGVIFYLMLTKYGNLKFGGDDTEPEFIKLQWFGMMYTCGVAVGLFYWGVAEPMSFWSESMMIRQGHLDDGRRRPERRLDAPLGPHERRRPRQLRAHADLLPLGHPRLDPLRPDRRAAGAPVVPPRAPDDDALVLLPALGQADRGLARRRRRRALDHVHALRRLHVARPRRAPAQPGPHPHGPRHVHGRRLLRQASTPRADPMRKTACGNSDPCRRKGKTGWDFNVKTQCWIVVFVTLLATCSVAVGLKRGIAVLSYLAFGMGMLLVTSVLFMDDTMYILDAMTTSFGYYLWYLPKIAWECDAWARLNSDQSWTGSAKRGGLGIDSNPRPARPTAWARARAGSPGWTVFYWGWWISWGPFCGTFLAKISKGRTLREFIIYSMIVPTLYCVLWFGTFGGAAIGMQMRADHIDAGTTYWGKDATHPLDTRMKGFSNAEHNQGYVVESASSGSKEDKFFDLISSYGGKGLAYGLTGWAWLCLLFYFITSSDSGSLVIDMIGANGEQEPPLPQRIFWAFTEGCAAIALLKGSQGDPDRALNGVSAVSVVCGLPFTVVLMYMSHALYLCCLEEAGDLDENRPSWRTVCLGLPKADDVGDWVWKTVLATVAPFISIWKVLSQVESSTGGADPIMSKEKMVLLYTALSAIFIYFGSILLIFSMWEANLRMIAASLYLAFATVVAYTRYMTRTGLGIKFGDAMTDVCLSVLFYPLVLAQCERECALGTIGGAPPQEKAKVSEA